MNNFDAVLVGSIVSVIVAVIIFVYLSFKVKKLMNQDAEKHKN
jgi:ABC-type proline/glycine betaine transport system permease subunit